MKVRFRLNRRRNTISLCCRILVVIATISIFTSVGAEGKTLEGRVISVTDGDTFTLLMPDFEKISVRLAEIDAPERGQPWGNRSRQALSKLILKESVTVEIQVYDRYRRPVGRPMLNGQDICVEMVRIGAAWVYRSYSDDKALYELERQAKAEKRGLWGLSEYERIPPWEWRHNVQPKPKRRENLEAFICGVKYYCRQMESCREAQFHFRDCGLLRLDGDNDGVPCESLCR